MVSVSPGRSTPPLAPSSQDTHTALRAVTADLSAAAAETTPGRFHGIMKRIVRFENLHPEGFSLHFFSLQSIH